MTVTTTSVPRTNAFAGKCVNCGQTVAAGEGILGGSRATGWKTSHLSGACPAPVARPAALTLDDVGIYVTADGTAIRVVKSQMRPGAVYTKTLVFSTVGERTTMDWAYTPGLSIAGLPKMTTAQAAQIGLQCETCVSCLAQLGGSTLSAKCSAILGFGETCAGNNGWTYPKGVRAQRELLAANAIAA